MPWVDWILVGWDILEPRLDGTGLSLLGRIWSGGMTRQSQPGYDAFHTCLYESLWRYSYETLPFYYYCPEP